MSFTNFLVLRPFLAGQALILSSLGCLCGVLLVHGRCCLPDGVIYIRVACKSMDPIACTTPCVCVSSAVCSDNEHGHLLGLAETVQRYGWQRISGAGNGKSDIDQSNLARTRRIARVWDSAHLRWSVRPMSLVRTRRVGEPTLVRISVGC